MYAAIRRYKTKPGSADVITQRAQEGFVPLVSSIAGFVAYSIVISENDVVTSISIFTDQAGEEGSTRVAADWVKQNLAQYVEGVPEITTGQVTVHEQK